MVQVHLLELNVVGPSCMARDRNTGSLVVTAHEYISVSGTGSSSQMSSSSGAEGKSSGVASWKGSSVFDIDVWW